MKKGRKGQGSNPGLGGSFLSLTSVLLGLGRRARHRWKALDETDKTMTRMTNDNHTKGLCEKATCPPDDSYDKECYDVA